MAVKSKLNKSEEVRKLHASGVTSASEILAKLKERGIKVAPAQVYQVIAKGKKRRGKNKTAEPVVRETVLDHAVVFVRSAGGIQRAKEMLTKLSLLQN